MSDAYLVIYGEIAVKSGSVRRRFERSLASNIERQVGGEVERLEGRLLVRDPDDPDGLSKVFGVEKWTRVLTVDEPDPEVVWEAVREELERLKGVRTFAVRSRRSWKGAPSSRVMDRELGSLILEGIGWGVDLDDPDLVVFVEMRREGTFVYLDGWVRKGPGGLPYGVESPLVCLVSGGIDSPVASWYVARRGCEVVWLHLDRGRFGSDVDVVEGLASRFSEWLPVDLDLVIEDFEDVLEVLSFLEGEDAAYRCVLCKREMLRRACNLCEDVGAVGVVTGDVIGQVASQIPDNLMVIDRASDYPVYRPLAGFDKNEVQRLSERLGFLDVSRKHSGCPVAPRRPVKRASLGKVLVLEEELGLLKRGLRGSGL